MAEFSREFHVDVTWWPFELHPETPPEGRDISGYVSARGDAYREHLKAYAADAGITFASNRYLANSHRALELAEFARDREAFDCVHDALFRACFEEARNIGDLEVLCEIATACGLDAEEFRVECMVGRYAQLVDYTTGLARQKGVSSTPTMIFADRLVVTGAQDMTVYRDVLERLGAIPRYPI